MKIRMNRRNTDQVEARKADKKTDQLRAKKAEQSALGWLSRQAAWEIRMDGFHTMGFGVPVAHSKSPNRKAA